MDALFLAGVIVGLGARELWSNLWKLSITKRRR